MSLSDGCLHNTFPTFIGVILGVYGDNAKENGNYCSGLYRV